jgi:NADH:ubiquinone oxidoreductase subunit E
MAIIDNPKYADRIAWHLSKYPDKRSAVMPLLYIAQEEYGWINDEAVREVAQIIEIDPTQVRSIAGFYTMYSEKPKGKYWLQVCTDLACALRGADEFHHELLHELHIEEGGTTAGRHVHSGARDVLGGLRPCADAAVQLPHGGEAERPDDG